MTMIRCTAELHAGGLHDALMFWDTTGCWMTSVHKQGLTYEISISQNT